MLVTWQTWCIIMSGYNEKASAIAANGSFDVIGGVEQIVVAQRLLVLKVGLAPLTVPERAG